MGVLTRAKRSYVESGDGAAGDVIEFQAPDKKPSVVALADIRAREVKRDRAYVPGE